MNATTEITRENKSRSVLNEVFRKQSGGASTFQFLDNRPEAIQMQKLQDMANNCPQVMQLRAFQEVFKNNLPENSAGLLKCISDKKVVQRMAAVARDEKSDEDDIIVLSSLNYALSAAGGPLLDFGPNSNFSTMNTNEELIVVSHGEKGKIGSFDSTQTVDVLTKPDKAIPKDIGGITLMSCYSGLDESDPDTSLADQVADELKDKGYTDIPVKGALGMAIASEATSARAVKPSKDDEYFRDVQYPLFFKFGFVKSFEKDPYFGRQPTELKTADEFLKENSIDPSELTFDEKVERVSQLTSGFYKKLIKEADSYRYLIDVGSDGIQVTWKAQ